MRFKPKSLLFLSVALLALPTAYGQSPFRIQRGTSPASSDSQTTDDGVVQSQHLNDRRQLSGGVEHRVVNPDLYSTPLNGRLDASKLQSGVGSTQIRAGVDFPQLRGALDKNGRPLQEAVPLMDQSQPLRGALDQRSHPLQGNADRNRPLPLGRDVMRTRLPGDVPDRDLNILRARDVVILQDRSSSMAEEEFFPQGPNSRWNWCLSQAMDFSRQTSTLPNWGFNLVLFSSHYDSYSNVNLAQLPSIYQRYSTGFYGTKLANPIGEQLALYFQRRASSHAKPLVIAVVTDGKPQDEHNLADVIVDATQQMRNPNEVHIVILQVGTDGEGQRKLAKLDYGLMSRGAKYDIVSVVPFATVTKMGLTRALIYAIESANVH